MDTGKPEEETDADRIKDTNVEGIGSEEHRDAREDAAKLEKAWKGAGSKAGLEIWRIEKFKVKRWPKKRYGEFYSGDSYIVLNSEELKDKDGNVLKMKYEVFFWLGSETSQDEAGTAAYKTVELDDFLGDEPVQYREVMGNESRMFLDCFKKMSILEGGVSTGFNAVKPKEYKPRLLKVTGYKDKVQVSQVKMDSSSLNNKDAFILDAGTWLYAFYGTSCNAWERRQCNSNINQIKSDRQGKVERTTFIDGLTDDQKEAKGFWQLLGGKPEKIIDGDESMAKEGTMRMIKISDESGTLKKEVVADGYLDLDMLDSNDVFIVDTILSIYIWVGKGANKKERKEAMPHAVAYLKSEDRDERAFPICRVVEGREPPHFTKLMKSKPKGWNADMMKDNGFIGRRSSVNVLRDLQDLDE